MRVSSGSNANSSRCRPMAQQQGRSLVLQQLLADGNDHDEALASIGSAADAESKGSVVLDLLRQGRGRVVRFAVERGFVSRR